MKKELADYSLKEVQQRSLLWNLIFYAFLVLAVVMVYLSIQKISEFDYNTSYNAIWLFLPCGFYFWHKADLWSKELKKRKV